MTKITIDRSVVEQALETLEAFMHDSPRPYDAMRGQAAMGALRAALAAPEEDPELSAALGWAAGISEPVLDRKTLLRRVAELAQDIQTKTKRAWDVGYDCGIKAASERRLSDSEIGEIWFAARIPGLTESDARRLIRAAEGAR